MQCDGNHTRCLYYENKVKDIQKWNNWNRFIGKIGINFFVPVTYVLCISQLLYYNKFTKNASTKMKKIFLLYLKWKKEQLDVFLLFCFHTLNWCLKWIRLLYWYAFCPGQVASRQRSSLGVGNGSFNIRNLIPRVLGFISSWSRTSDVGLLLFRKWCDG